METWGVVLMIPIFSKLKTTFCKHWTSIKVKMIQEQYLQLKRKFWEGRGRLKHENCYLVGGKKFVWGEFTWGDFSRWGMSRYSVGAGDSPHLTLHFLSEFISNNTETFREILLHKSLSVRVHIKQYWHFWRVSTKQCYTNLSEFISPNTFSESCY